MGAGVGESMGEHDTHRVSDDSACRWDVHLWEDLSDQPPQDQLELKHTRDITFLTVSSCPA